MTQRTTIIRYSVAVVVCAVVGILLVSLGRSVTAQGPPGQTQLTVTEVSLNVPTPDLLSIVGENFDNGPSLDITLGEFPGSLGIISATSTQIIAALPDPLPAGDYLLTVSSGAGPSRRDDYDLTVGAVPPGSIILWDQSTTCPNGFARVSSYDGRFLLAASTPGHEGGSNTHSHGVGTFTAPEHRHALEPWDRVQPPVDDNAGGTDFNARTGLAGGGTMTGTSGETDSRPEFTSILLCRKV